MPKCAALCYNLTIATMMGGESHMINSIPSLLYLACMVLALPCALLAALVLGLRKGGVHKGLWTAVCILSLLCALGMILIEGIAAYLTVGGALTPMLMVRRALVPLVCIVPALVFPLTLNGRMDGLKALLLVPAMLLSICSVFMYRLSNSLPMLMVYLPLLAVLLLAAAWAISGRKTALGIGMALCAAGCLLVLPLLSATAGHCLQTMVLEPLAILRVLPRMVPALFSDPFRMITRILIAALPLPAYALLAMLTTAGLLSAKLPGKAAAKRPAPQPAPQAAPRPAQASSPRYCVQCGAQLQPGVKFCIKCGKPVR